MAESLTTTNVDYVLPQFQVSHMTAGNEYTQVSDDAPLPVSAVIVDGGAPTLEDLLDKQYGLLEEQTSLLRRILFALELAVGERIGEPS